MRGLLLAVAVAACSMTPATQARLVAACDVDGKIMPLAQEAAANMGVPGQTAAAIDALLVHPAVVAACAQLGGKPEVTVVAVPAATAAPGQ